MFKVTFVSSKNISNSINVSKLYVNDSLKDNWVQIMPNTIVSFKNILIKLVLEDKEPYYLLIDNLLLQFNEKEAFIYYDTDLKSFIQTVDKKYLKDLKLKHLLIKEKLNKNRLGKIFNWNSIDQTEHELLKKEEFDLNAQIYYSLIKKELPWN
ncbi:MSC_0621 family F1-like ATPase epsilon subunit [Mycoplasmopsis columboralis]|uniref:Uncharacterized protein n=1 Tax=Mycoplasmopsis columboralis TaxID=171282 RepID=A0A449B6B8_9BACT|nr:hypothetical protein [Mycoplasmopsis columboralis]VEU76144.1 Uncharacterised protein [Mycoplasmopsis columboralis]